MDYKKENVDLKLYCDNNEIEIDAKWDLSNASRVFLSKTSLYGTIDDGKNIKMLQSFDFAPTRKFGPFGAWFTVKIDEV